MQRILTNLWWQILPELAYTFFCINQTALVQFSSPVTNWEMENNEDRQEAQ